MRSKTSRSSIEQYNLDLILLMQRFFNKQQLFDLSKSLESRANKLAGENLSFSEAKASLTVKSIRNVDL